MKRGRGDYRALVLCRGVTLDEASSDIKWDVISWALEEGAREIRDDICRTPVEVVIYHHQKVIAWIKWELNATYVSKPVAARIEFRR